MCVSKALISQRIAICLFPRFYQIKNRARLYSKNKVLDLIAVGGRCLCPSFGIQRVEKTPVCHNHVGGRSRLTTYCQFRFSLYNLRFNVLSPIWKLTWRTYLRAIELNGDMSVMVSIFTNSLF